MKKILIISGVFVFITITLIEMKQSEMEQLSMLTLENIDALSSGDVSAESSKSKICYKDVEYDENNSRASTTYYCGDCKEVPYTSRDNQHICKMN